MDAITSSGNYLGTDRLGRPLTDGESKQLGALLRKHDFPGASLVALRFAHKLTRSRGSAQDLLGRTNLMLVRWGWDPNVVPLKSRMCRLVWCEFTHQKRETETAVRAEQAFLREQAIEAERFLPAAPTRGEPAAARALPPDPVTPSAEQQLLLLQEEREEDARREKELDRLRGSLPELQALFRKRNDDVNLLWLKYRLEGIDDPATMARDSGRDVADFYAAQKRRERAVRRVLGMLDESVAAADRGEEESA